jgi:hypothetical protein
MAANSLVGSSLLAGQLLSLSTALPLTELIGFSQPAPGYVVMIPGNQPPGSGSAKSLVKTPGGELYPSVMTGNGTQSDATMWANPGWMTVSAGATAGGLEIPLAAYNPNFGAKCQVIAVNIKAAAPAAVVPFLGNGNGFYGTLGMQVNVTTTGKLQIAIYSTPGFTVIGYGTSNLTYFDATEHALLIFTHPSGLIAVYRDGDLDFTVTPDVITNPIGQTVCTANFCLGSGSGSAYTAFAAMYRGLHILNWDVPPINIGQIAKVIAAAPAKPLTAADVSFPSRVVTMYWAAGQSNEAGAGNDPGATGFIGIPHRDTGGRSIVSGLAYLLAKRGIAAIWAQTAVGSTAITDSWCGRVRVWANPTNVLGGSYVTSGGKTWRCTLAAGAVGVSTVLPSTTTGVDAVSWADLGVSTIEDTAVLTGTGVYPASSARFDPNGLIATSISKASRIAPYTSMRVGVVSIGQGDSYVQANAAAYSDAMQKVALRNIAAGADKVLLGMTCRPANGTDDAWFTNQLLPGRLTALAALSGNAKVFAGHDWATFIGPTTVQTLPVNIGVRSDGVHMTTATYETRAVISMDSAQVAAGV